MAFTPWQLSDVFRFQIRPDNNVLIRSGEDPGIGWSRNMLYSGFITLHRSVFWSAGFNGRSDNTDVIQLPILAGDMRTKIYRSRIGRSAPFS